MEFSEVVGTGKQTIEALKQAVKAGGGGGGGNLEPRVKKNEDDISALKIEDVSLDDRITALEDGTKTIKTASILTTPDNVLYLDSITPENCIKECSISNILLADAPASAKIVFGNYTTSGGFKDTPIKLVNNAGGENGGLTPGCSEATAITIPSTAIIINIGFKYAGLDSYLKFVFMDESNNFIESTDIMLSPFLAGYDINTAAGISKNIAFKIIGSNEVETAIVEVYYN